MFGKRRLISLAAGVALVGGILAVGAAPVRAAQTYTVVTQLDTPPATPGCTTPTFTGSLRQCIEASNTAGGNNTIVFAAPTNGLPFVLTNGQLVIDGQTLTMTGNGEANTVIDGNAASRIFAVDSNATASMSALTVRNGSFVNNTGGFSGGGGIRNDGSLSLSHVTVTANTASSGTTNVVTSGAIWDEQGSLTLDHATVTNNMVSATHDAAAGAIQLCCSGGFGSVHLTVTNSLFSGNVAKITTSAGGQAYGGAITANSDGTVSISNTTFTANSVTVPATNNGGAGALLNHGTMTIDSSTFTKNTVDVPDGGSSGAIENCCGGGTVASMTITNSLIEGNSVSGMGSDSGGVSNCCGATKLTISGSTIDNNTVTGAGSSGGGLSNTSTSQPVIITNSTIYHNTVSGLGGVGGNLELAPCGCTTGPFSLVNVTLDGGAAAQGSNIELQRDGNMSLTNTIIAGSPGANCVIGPGTTVTDGGHNLEDSTTSSCGLSTAKSDQLVTDAHLGALADNGGPTTTQALLAGSAAIDNGLNSACPSTDQRGDPRFFSSDPTCDIGAFEVQAVVQVTPTVPSTGVPLPLAPAIALVIVGAGLRRLARRRR